MAREIPADLKELFQKKSFGHLVTLMPDGQPQSTPVWVDYDGRHVLVNTARGRQKVANVERDPRVSISITHPENPYRYLEVRGRVVALTPDGADAHIDRLAQRYLAKSRYPFRAPGEERVILEIEPENVSYRK